MALPQKWELRRQTETNGNADVHVLREINGFEKILGRGGQGVSNSIVCQSNFVSRKHCRITFIDGVFYLEDFESLNGTFLNGTKINPRQRRELRDQDVIGMGLSKAEEADGGDYFIFIFVKCIRPRLVNPTAKPMGLQLVDLTTHETECIDISSDSDSKNTISAGSCRKIGKGDALMPIPVIRLQRIDEIYPEYAKGALLGVGVTKNMGSPKAQTSSKVDVIRKKRTLDLFDSSDSDSEPQTVKKCKSEDKTEHGIQVGLISASSSSSSDESDSSADHVSTLAYQPKSILLHAKTTASSSSNIFKRSQGLGSKIAPYDNRLNHAKEKIHGNQVPQRSTMILDHAPLPRRPTKRHQTAPQHLMSKDSPMLISNKQFYGSHVLSSITHLQPELAVARKEKLAEVARIEKLKKSQGQTDLTKKAASAPVAKVTPRNRQDMLLESLAPTTSGALRTDKYGQPSEQSARDKKMASGPNLREGVPKSGLLKIKKKTDGVTASIVVKSNCPGLAKILDTQTEMPLEKIQREITNSGPVSVPLKRAKVIAPSIENVARDMLKPTKFGNNNNAGIVSRTQLATVAEDRVYRDILSNWKTAWLQDDSGRIPPVHGNLDLITNLPHYNGDFKSYSDTFHPLMLHELWASITNEYKKSRRNNQSQNYRLSGICDYEVGIEKIEGFTQCPLVTPESKNRLGTETSFWHVIHLMSFTDTKQSFNKELDFGKFFFDMKVDDVITRKEVFFFVLPNSDFYEECSDSTIVHNLLYREMSKKKYKYCLQIVTHLKQDESANVCVERKCRIEKIAYVFPKIRDFRLFARLPESKLFHTLLNPMPPRLEDIYNPNRVISPAELIRSVHANLNPIQRSIVQHVSSRILQNTGPEVLLLHGPPGTGKTRTIVYLILQILLSSKPVKPKILLCTPSNTALDELLRRLDKVFGVDLKMVRIGHSNTCSLDTKKYVLEELVKKTSISENISEAIADLDCQISSAEGEIGDMEKVKSNTNEIVIKKSIIDDLKKRRSLYAEDLEKLQRNRKNMDIAKRQILGNAHVIASTLNSCASLKREISALTKERNHEPFFRCCIVDEATQTTEPESLSPLSLGCEKILLVGDPKQLPATVLSGEAERRLLRQSLFTRLFNYFEEQTRRQLIMRSPVMMLTVQYRMHPEILRWPNQRFYENKLRTDKSVLEDIKRNLRIRPYVFLNIKGQEARNLSNQISNLNELALVREILKILQNQQTLSKNHIGLNIGIISPYNEQKEKLRDLWKEFANGSASDRKFGENIEIDTVDSFQGREKDIVILSCVRTEDLGFLKTPERLNVALTRAKMSLIIIGDAECLNKNEMWKTLMDNAVQNDAFHRIPDDYRKRGEKYLHQVLEQKLLV